MFFLPYENSTVYGKKGHHWSRVSNGWLHFVDLFRLSDSDTERTIGHLYLDAALVGDTVSLWDSLFMRPWTTPQRSDALWKRGLDTHTSQRKIYRPCYIEWTSQILLKTYMQIKQRETDRSFCLLNESEICQVFSFNNIFRNIEKFANFLQVLRNYI